MKKQLFAILAVEVSLVAAIGILTSLVSSTLSIDSATVWALLVLFLLILIPTSWLRYKYENDRQDFSLGIRIPENISFSISLASIKKNFSLILTILINGALFGYLGGVISVLLSHGGLADLIHGISFFLYSIYIPATGHEIIGGAIIAVASLIVMRRLSVVLGVIFCVSSSLAFSFTHMGMFPGQPFWFTLLGNLASFLIFTSLLQLIYPVIAKFIIDFWRNLFR